MIVSDYTSVNEMSNHRLGDLQAVSALAIKAGLDMDMVGEGFLSTLKKSLQEKKLTLADIDRACRKVLEAKYKLGLFDDPYRYIDENRSKTEILTPENRAMARKVATQSFVLLKNDKQTLPLSKSKRIALIGPLANDKNNMLGTWSVSGDPQLSIPVYQGVQSKVASTNLIAYAKGSNITDDTALAKRVNVFGLRADIDKRSPDAMLEEAMAIAKSSDVVVAVVGEATEMTGEAASRADITLPAAEQKLLKALYATGKPVVVVIMSGRPLVLTGSIEGAASVLQVWHAGTEAGNAIADVLYGDVNPSGKLSMSFPYHVGQIPVYYSQKTTGRPQDLNNKFSSRYLDIPNEPLFPFGYGLSYSRFEYSNLNLSNNKMNADGSIKVSVNLTNAGRYDGAEVVQLYIEDKVRSITPPAKELKAFQKVFLKAGESRVLEFNITKETLSFWNASLQFVAEPGEFAVHIGGNSRDLLSASFDLK
jgi:beta-glucosidase